MKKDKRKWDIIRDSTGAIFRYKGKNCPLTIGRDDDIVMFRDEDSNFLLLATHRGLGYASCILISNSEVEILHEIFFQNIQEVLSESGIKKDFFEYSTQWQAKFLNQWLY